MRPSQAELEIAVVLTWPDVEFGHNEFPRVVCLAVRRAGETDFALLAAHCFPFGSEGAGATHSCA